MLATAQAIQATPAAKKVTPFSEVARFVDSDHPVFTVNIGNAIIPAANDVPVVQGELVPRSTVRRPKGSQCDFKLTHQSWRNVPRGAFTGLSTRTGVARVSTSALTRPKRTDAST